MTVELNMAAHSRSISLAKYFEALPYNPCQLCTCAFWVVDTAELVSGQGATVNIFKQLQGGRGKKSDEHLSHG